MAKTTKLTRIYEAPMVLDLGSLARGSGQGPPCEHGSVADGDPFGCRKGGTAACNASPPTACCRNGTTPTPLNSLGGEGQGFDAGPGSGGEGSGFRVP